MYNKVGIKCAPKKHKNLLSAMPDHTVSVGCADLRVLVRRRVGVQEAEHAEPGHVG